MTLRGVFCAAATPVKADLSPDHDLLIEHVKRLLAEGCHGIAMLGTTSEANSFSMAERKAMLEAVVKSGVDPKVLMPGTGLSAIPETVELTRHALSLGVTRCVVLPPFYYKGVSDEGLLDAYTRIIEGVADERFEIVLYHIPQISAVPLSFALIAALIAKFPRTIVGIKDSAGDLDHMKQLVAHFPQLAVFAGADPLMLPLLEAGGAGCITATSNLLGADLRTVFDNYADPAAADKVAKAQARVIAYRNVSNSYVQIPTIKAMIADHCGNPDWRRVRPPFVALDDAALVDLAGKLAELNTAG